MITQLSDGTLHDVADNVAAERGPATSHSDRNDTLDLMLTHLPGRS